MDLEKHLLEWIRRGVPLGMSMEIPRCGIFPKADDPEQEVEEAPELAEQLGMANYKSFTDEPEHVRTELGRLVEEGFAVVLPTGKASEVHKHGTVSKLALLVKEKEDGSVKRWIIIDLLRSGGNAHTTRVVLWGVCRRSRLVLLWVLHRALGVGAEQVVLATGRFPYQSKGNVAIEGAFDEKASQSHSGEALKKGIHEQFAGGQSGAGPDTRGHGTTSVATKRTMGLLGHGVGDPVKCMTKLIKRRRMRTEAAVVT